MPSLSKRTAGFTDSVIRRMTRISNKYGAVNLSQGFPDFDPPAEILSRLEAVAHEDFHQYSITWGAQNFREALARKYEHFSGQKIDPNAEIVVTCGSTEAMMTAMMSVTDPGDKVIVFSPFYENYGADTILPAQSRYMFRLSRRISVLTQMCLKPHSDSTRKLLYYAIRQIPAERFLLTKSLKLSLNLQKNMMRS